MLPIWLKKLIDRTATDRSLHLTELERSMIEKVAETLNPTTHDRLQRQLLEDYLVDRSNNRISAIYFYRLPDALLIADPEFQDLLYKIKTMVDGKTQTNRVTFYEGRIFSVELRKPRKNYADCVLEIVSVTKGEPKDTLTSVIDRAAHGKP